MKGPSRKSSEPQAAPEPPARQAATLRRYDYWLWLVLLATLAGLHLLTGGALLSPQNLSGLIIANSHIFLMVPGMLLVMQGRNADLSAGAVAALSLTLVVVLPGWLPGLSVWLVVPVCLLAGAAFGAALGGLVVLGRLPSLLITLAAMLILAGIRASLPLPDPAAGALPEAWSSLAAGFVPDIAAIGLPGSGPLILAAVLAALVFGVELATRRIGQKYGVPPEPVMLFWGRILVFPALLLAGAWRIGQGGALPNVALLIVGIAVLYAGLSGSTVAGRQLRATGADPRAARQAGIPTQRLTVLTFASMGGLAALAGLIMAGQPVDLRSGQEFSLGIEVIAAALVGGAPVAGGAGRVTGVMIGALLIALINSAAALLGAGEEQRLAVIGCIVIGAALAGQTRRDI